jgi:hypothetical protein
MTDKEIIVVHVDLSKSFVDPVGTFYCGTTEEQKANAARLAAAADWNLYCTDLHPMSSNEFSINGGLYPLHSVPRADELDMAAYGLAGKTASPRLTEVVAERIDRSCAGIYAPRQLYYQEPDGSLSFTPEDVEATFGLPIITEEQFLSGGYTYVVMPKYFFDSTRLTIDPDLEAAPAPPGVPRRNLTVFSLIKKRRKRGEGLVFIVPSVVENICTHHTASGIRQDFPLARVIIPSDAVTPLAGVGLGFETGSQVGIACTGLARDIGIEYKTTERIVAELKNYSSSIK